MSKWEEIMGSLSSKVSIFKIHNNMIVLAVSDSSWMQELHLLSELIKEKINTILGSKRIESIKLKYVAQSKKFVQKTEKKISSNYATRPLTTQELQALQKIQDPELSQALVGFLQKCHHFS